MPTFKNTNHIEMALAPAGEHILKVIDFEIGVSTGSKTRGSPQFDLTFEVEGIGCRMFDCLIDAPDSDWCQARIDTFLKSSGAAATLKPGQSFTFRQDEAKADCPWIDPIGLRVHARVDVERYWPSAVPQNQRTPANIGQMKEKNKVSRYLTDKPALPRAEVPRSEPEPF